MNKIKFLLKKIITSETTNISYYLKRIQIILYNFIYKKKISVLKIENIQNLEKLKENAFDFFSTNSFSYSFHDHSFKTSLDEVNRKTLDERINEYKSYTVALNINQNPRVIISLLSSIADEAAKISLYEEASEYLQKALKKAKEEKFSYEEASIKSNLGVCYQNLGDINKALKYCEEAKKISKQIGDIEGVASSLGNIGVIYKIKGDLDKALNYHEESQKISKQIDNLEGIANSLNNIGNIYQIKGNLDKALNLGYDFLKFSRVITDNLREEMDSERMSSGGYLIIMDYESKNNYKYLFVALLNNKIEYSISNNLELSQFLSLNIDKMAMASVINISKYTKKHSVKT